MTKPNRDMLAGFALEVLDIMAGDENEWEWTADTTMDIAAAAERWGLATADDGHGRFVLRFER